MEWIFDERDGRSTDGEGGYMPTIVCNEVGGINGGRWENNDDRLDA